VALCLWLGDNGVALSMVKRAHQHYSNNYEQFPFKCMVFHEYGHFVMNFPKNVLESNPVEPNEQWQQRYGGEMTNVSFGDNFPLGDEHNGNIFVHILVHRHPTASLTI
jgi:hypothetical protein